MLSIPGHKGNFSFLKLVKPVSVIDQLILKQEGCPE
jgi:hypothetical protein